LKVLQVAIYIKFNNNMKNNNRGKALKTLLSRNIKLLRVNSGLSQAELAEKAEISVPYLGAVERGDKWPSPATLAEIAYSLGIEPYVLLKPESIPSIEIKKIIVKLDRDITALISDSVKVMNNIAKGNEVIEKKKGSKS